MQGHIDMQTWTPKRERRSLTSKKIRRKFLALPTPKHSTPKAKEAWERPGNGLEVKNEVGRRREIRREWRRGEKVQERGLYRK